MSVILAHGWARARCEKCSQDSLVAYSFKGRVVCTSCSTLFTALISRARPGGKFTCASARSTMRSTLAPNDSSAAVEGGMGKFRPG